MKRQREDSAGPEGKQARQTAHGRSHGNGVESEGNLQRSGTSPSYAGFVTNPQTPRGGSVKFENALDFLDQVKLQFMHQPHIYNQFLDVMKEFKAGTIDTPGVIARVSELFKGHESLVGGFNTFLPPGYKIELPDESPASRKQPEFDHARAYVKKIKMRFVHQPHTYKSFLEILHTFHREQHTIKDVYDQVATLFHDHPDLLEEFSQFLPDPQANQNLQPSLARKAARVGKSGKLEQKSEKRKKRGIRKGVDISRKQDAPDDSIKELNFFYKVKKKLNNGNLYAEFLKCLNMFSQKIVNRLELVILVREILGLYPDLFERFKGFIGFTEEDELDFSERRGAGLDFDEKDQKWSLSDIDFSACKRYGPSYRALPKNYQQPLASGGSEMTDDVLNNKYVSVPTGSEDFGFKGTRKNQYEEVLFKCEDDRYELDLVIELNASTLRALEPILKRIAELSEEESSEFKLDTPMDVLHIRSIERIYGNKGPDVVERLFSNPVVAVPVILKRLKQKDHEWRNARREWNKIWREVNEKNYHRSLDHRGFYFKQVEKKNLSSKVLLAEIKQQYQEKLKARKVHPAYHLKYVMDDVDVFNDITDLVTNAAERILSKSDREKLDALLEHFVKAFFCVVKDDAVKSTSHCTVSATIDGPGSTGAEISRYQSTPLDSLNGASTLGSQQVLELSLEKGKDKGEQENSDSSGLKGTHQSSVPQTLKSRRQIGRPRPSSKDVRLFFGNSAFYCFFRLYQILYERLSKAKRMEETSEKEKWAASILTPPAPKDKTTKKQEPYQHLITSIYSLMEGSLDQTKFEDDCRDMFGVSSYILFTIDKLIFQLAKQLQILLSDETCAKLLALYTYEGARPKGSIEVIYHSNVLELMGDEKCFRFEFSKDTSSLTIQLLDSSQKPRFLDLSFSKDKWAEYVDSYVQSESSNLDVRRHKIFLPRSQRKGANPKAMENVIIQNRLECKICLSTYRLFYVEDTEDFFYRRRGSPRYRANPKQIEKFRKWHNTFQDQNL